MENKIGPWIVDDKTDNPKGNVYVVRRRKGGSLYVLKRPQKGKLYQFTREVEALKQLHHPGIVKMIDYSLDMSNPYFVTEYVSGGALAETDLSEWTYKEKEFLFNAVCNTLGYIFKKGIHKGDWNLNNILLKPDKQPVICDFEAVGTDIVDPNPAGYFRLMAKLHYRIMVGEEVHELSEEN